MSALCVFVSVYLCVCLSVCFCVCLCVSVHVCMSLFLVFLLKQDNEVMKFACFTSMLIIQRSPDSAFLTHASPEVQKATSQTKDVSADDYCSGQHPMLLNLTSSPLLQISSGTYQTGEDSKLMLAFDFSFNFCKCIWTF